MTPLPVKLDEHLGKITLQVLREASYDVDTVLGERLSGSTDEQLWSRVVADGRFLITLDLDFSDVRRFRPGTHPGNLLIRARSTSSPAVLRVLRQLRLGCDKPLHELAVRQDIESLEQAIEILRGQEDRPRFTFAREDEPLQELVGAVRKIGEPRLPVG
jgi:predicted nuclease of predicted toxin-antitoxin system